MQSQITLEWIAKRLHDYAEQFDASATKAMCAEFNALASQLSVINAEILKTSFRDPDMHLGDLATVQSEGPHYVRYDSCTQWWKIVDDPRMAEIALMEKELSELRGGIATLQNCIGEIPAGTAYPLGKTITLLANEVKALRHQRDGYKRLQEESLAEKTDDATGGKLGPTKLEPITPEAGGGSNKNRSKFCKRCGCRIDCADGDVGICGECLAPEECL